MPTESRKRIERMSPAVGDENLLPPDCRELERQMAALVERPRGAPRHNLSVEVARRVINRTGSPVGRVGFTNGPFDTLPSDVSVGARLRLGGHSHVERTAGDAIYEGELVMTSRHSMALLHFPDASQAWLGPSSALLCTFDERSDVPRLRMMAGRVLFLVATRNPGRADPDDSDEDSPEMVHVLVPSGEARSSGGVFQVATLNQSTSRVEVIEGIVHIQSRKGAVVLGRHQTCAVDALQTPSAEPIAAVANLLSWLAPVTKLPELPAGARQRLESLYSSGFAGKLFNEAVEAEKKSRGRLLVIVGAIVLAVVIAIILTVLGNRP